MSTASETLIIPLTLPGLNEYINAERSNRYKGAHIKRQTQNDIEIFIRQAINKGTLHRHENQCELEITWIEPNNRRDGDNISFATKFIQDALVEMGVFPDDSRKYINGLKHTFMTNQRDPQIIVEIKEKKND